MSRIYEPREREISYSIHQGGVVKIVFDEKLDELIMSAEQLRAFGRHLLKLADDAQMAATPKGTSQ